MDEDIYGIAIKWFVRLRADNITANEQDDFFEWFFKSKDNHQTFADVLTLWDRLEVIKAHAQRTGSFSLMSKAQLSGDFFT
ncbi:MAG: ferric-dicitrate binding protein FerR (iron transport regulator) [Candidatus Azotimanducaceae bacterium]|jgi:ferric-dicitrate binding protein FerR (iron transport regulator)